MNRKVHYLTGGSSVTRVPAWRFTILAIAWTARLASVASTSLPRASSSTVRAISEVGLPGARKWACEFLRLERFLFGNAQAAGKRGVLVITGKGRADQGYGVLRRAVPTWLNQPPNRARIIAVHDAQPRDGGSGALYLLLRKRR